jgi:hypothetical protein
LEDDYENEFDNQYKKIDKRFTYKNICKKHLQNLMGVQTCWNTHTDISGKILKPSPNLYSWNITFDTPFFHKKTREYYKKIEEQYNEKEFNKFIGLSETI